MKTLYFTLFIALICSIGYAQKQEPFRIDSLPKQGILLDKGWKWHAGDNPDFAKIDLDDSDWESIDPTKDIIDLPQIRKAGFGWFRLRIAVDSLVGNTIVSLLVKQSIASEIYHNNQLIGKFGKVSNHPENVRAYNPYGYYEMSQIIHLYTGNKEDQVLAVRFAIQPLSSYKKFFDEGFKCMIVKVFKSDNTSQLPSFDNSFEKRGNFSIDTSLFYFKTGIFFIMFFIHFFFYVSQRLNIANLYFGIYCFVMIFYNSYQAITLQYLHYVSNWEFYFKIYWFLVLISSIFQLIAIYSLFKFRRGIIYRILFILSIIFLIFEFFQFELPSYIGYFISILMLIDIMRIAIVAYKNKKEGALIFLIGSTSSILFFITYLFNISPNSFDIYTTLSSNLFLLTIPICITFFLAQEFGKTSRSLALKLKENQVLSAEKQQILFAQNETLEKQVSQRTFELNNSLEKLKSTQAQLIQKEKLASLGELTAGIAHEIQNPLNFVNNFSELSVDLAKELKEEAEKSEIDKELIIDLATDLSQNQEKINHHGKRASSIVKGMLEHSRTSTGERVLTDINKLADEYLRLSYLGIRAKDNNFNSDYQTDFDENLPKIAVIPQDIGRVLLNLVNNAFWAVNERSKNGEAGYEPKVIISTELKAKSQLLIAIKDNGTGMSKATKAKIFQPFFTTKPTGQGTGLGLSLAYDIVTKGHGGTIECESVEGVGTEFIIQLSIV